MYSSRSGSAPARHKLSIARGLLAVLCGGVLFVLARHAEAQYLTFTLPAPLKQGACVGDTDNDCLNQWQEQDLAWMASPNYFYDEGEECDSGQHYGIQDYFQVRPYDNGTPVSSWTNDSSWKWVRVSYYLNYPHDCNVWAGHQGDNERIEVWLFSQDLINWSISDARFFHHSGYHDYSGVWLATMASNIGTVYLNAAYDEDGHGSWPGYGYNSSKCDNDTRMGQANCDWYFGCDCFTNTMQDSFSAGNFILLPNVTRNIGGPYPESWNTSVLTNDGTNNWYSAHDVGHGANAEYWSVKGGMWNSFCGWQCSWRQTNGDCANTVHAETACVPAMHEKLDYQGFTK